MAFSVSAAALFAILTAFLLRARYLSAGTAVVVFLCGFFVAGTGAYGPIHAACQAVAAALARLIG
ncbi:hypothetical protein [Streptomyces sp. MST-110588]|uniref:hypothetical protein n=1 Tax=Streptomyces sp. MST-110588 TaxID=2833628 RepID=UPI001F5D1F67|nr:hypothetical protein [Streptomyces sp. MST-110588]UNO42434.1 hypothetical protein KGS77_26550 [Streptomyces sp. MST-110588]